MSFAIGYLHPGTVRHEFIECIWQVMLSAKGVEGSEVVTIPVQSGANLSVKRNEMVERFLAIEKPELSGLLVVDTDIVFTLDNVKAIIQSPYPITSGLYVNPDGKGGTFPVFNMGRSKLRHGDWDDVKAAGGQRFPVAAVGMGFCYIYGDVLQDLGIGPLWPYAEYEALPGMPVSEDVGFCLRAAQRNFGCWVDPAIKVGHVKETVI